MTDSEHTPDPEVAHLLAQPRWNAERRALRNVARAAGLSEDVKWGKLCYSLDASKVMIIYGMKSYCAIGFFKGVLMDDPDQLLHSPGKHSQAMRQLRFSGLPDISRQEQLIERYIRNAIQVEKSGQEVSFDEKDNLVYPDELQDALDDDADLAAAFDNLTPGRQRGYVLDISAAKQSETRLRRVERHRARILSGKGLRDGA